MGKTWISTGVSVWMAIAGDFDPTIFDVNPEWSLPFGTILFVLVYLFLINGWTAVLVNLYEEVRVVGGYTPPEYRWYEWEYAAWLFPKPLVSFYFTYLRPRRTTKPPFMRLE